MNLRLIVTAAAAVGGAAALIRHNIRLTHERDELRATLDRVPAEVLRRIQQASEEPYELPLGAKTIRDTAIGRVSLAVASGRFSGRAIFVYLPKGFRFPPQMLVAFNEATNGEFHIDCTAEADAMISAGIDYAAYTQGNQGYWKISPAPRLEETADLLWQLIVQFQEQMVVAKA